MKALSEVVERTIVDELVLIPVGELNRKLSGIITLNNTAEFIWHKLKNDASENQLLKFVIEEYEVNKETAINDIRELTATMIELGIVTADNESKMPVTAYAKPQSGTQVYTKPEIKYENFVINSCVAGNCSIMTGDLGIDIGEIEDMDIFCYFNGMDGLNVFAS